MIENIALVLVLGLASAASAETIFLDAEVSPEIAEKLARWKWTSIA